MSKVPEKLGFDNFTQALCRCTAVKSKTKQSLKSVLQLVSDSTLDGVGWKQTPETTTASVSYL